ncbi:unnamed protein product [Chrysoparadoxa australica]
MIAPPILGLATRVLMATGSGRSCTAASAAAVQVFCDLDGVLCDFDAGVRRVFNGKGPEYFHRGSIAKMWGGLARVEGGFYSKLDWMPGGYDLWQHISVMDPAPIILTGLPRGTWAEPQKRAWCQRELGDHVQVITCMSRDKQKYCVRAGSILIDDREDVGERWMQFGGHFVHHVSTESSILQLERLLRLSNQARGS